MNVESKFTEETQDRTLPLVLAGPILRRTESTRICVWLATSEPLIGHLIVRLAGTQHELARHTFNHAEQKQVGEHAWITLAEVKGCFPVGENLEYDVETEQGALNQLLPGLHYDECQHISFKVSTDANHILHGSCRHPHNNCKDSLVVADRHIGHLSVEDRPSLLLLSGDQIYADMVSGIMLDAITQVVDLLGLHSEVFDDDDSVTITDSDGLYNHPRCYYGRESLLPQVVDDHSQRSLTLQLKKRPIFSSREGENHLITFGEFIAMYLLVWSPVLWQHIDRYRLEKKLNFVWQGEKIAPEWQQRWHKEKDAMDAFVRGLSATQRLMAHVPTYMIFDDHDITDDWNLTAAWEFSAYQNALSRRVIGNGLMSYWLCQGWGNAPDIFKGDFMKVADRYFTAPEKCNHDAFIEYLFRFEQWHYTIDTQPQVVVLDTRTRRWRSESRLSKPSGLMDWEAMMELQQAIMHQDKVIIVSAAPMFGVKFIETLQRAATWMGDPLLVDAENWMAHPGSANTLLSIFTHTRTPTNFVILSGDVHYSFAYDITLRMRKGQFHIYQITCSGIKNTFPEPLLTWCDLADRFLYSPNSPLNWFTKRKKLKIRKRDPDTQGQHRLVNQSGIGELFLDEAGKPIGIHVLTSDNKRVTFPPLPDNDEHD